MTKCSVDGCSKRATVEVLLYDLYPDGHVTFEQDFTCPWLCAEHMLENEAGAKSHNLMPELVGVDIRELLEQYREPEPTRFRKARGVVHYPFTNQHGAQGFTIYQPVNRPKGAE